MNYSRHETLGLLLYDLSRIMRKRFDRRARKLGLTRAQWRVLSVLRFQQGINQSSLAEALEIEPITLARHIDRLEGNGWVERRADPKDRRAWLLYLDDSVQSILKDLEQISEWNREAALAGFSEAEVRRFIDNLKRAKANLDAAECDEVEHVMSTGEHEKVAGERNG